MHKGLRWPANPIGRRPYGYHHDADDADRRAPEGAWRPRIHQPQSHTVNLPPPPLIEVARAVRQAVAFSWNAYVGLAQIIKNSRTQVRAAQLALNGVQQEYQAGTRTTLDVLDAQRDLVQAL